MGSHAENGKCPLANTADKIAEHAGFQRAIISENPPLVDDEGYEVDSDDNEDRIQEAMASAMEDNPYSSIRLERRRLPSFEMW